MAKFQTGGMRSKGVTDNLIVLIIDHSEYLEKELRISFYDIEKCFDSLWLEDCINSLWNCGVQNDILYLIYLLNRNADFVVILHLVILEHLRLQILSNKGQFLDQY